MPKHDWNELRKVLYSAVISDVLDEKGYRNQAMNYDIRPVDPEDVIMGRAFTALATETYQIPEKPYEMELKAVDSVGVGEIFVATTNGCLNNGFWGELLSTACKGHGAEGAIIDGLTRDSKKIREIKFPIFVKGFSPYDSKGRCDVIDIQVPIKCGGVLVNPGDIVFADFDGIVVIPKDIEDEIIDMALAKVQGENVVRDELLAGASAREVFEKYHIL